MSKEYVIYSNSCIFHRFILQFVLDQQLTWKIATHINVQRVWSMLYVFVSFADLFGNFCLYFVMLIVNCRWGSWNTGSCTKTCGSGIRTKTRTKTVVEKNGGSCTGSAIHMEHCNTHSCLRMCYFLIFAFIIDLFCNVISLI